MSSSVGYSYSYVDVEAMACRSLRIEIAGHAARTRVLRAQARRLRGAGRDAAAGRLARPAAGAGSTELSALAASYRMQVESAERELAGLQAAKWASLLAAPAGPAWPAVELSATGELARSRVAGTRDQGSAPRGSATAGGEPAAAQVVAADRLIASELGRCDAADLESLQRLRAEISSASTTRRARLAFAELEVAVADSIRRRRSAEEVEQVRASLLELVEYALPEERPLLRPMIEEAVDPGELSAVVGQAAARADLILARDAVAEAAADALREIGCDVGDDFAALLTGQSETVVSFGDGWAAGYGLLVKLPADSGRMMAAVVKREGTAASVSADEAVQRQFCDRGLQRWTGSLHGRGVVLADEQRMEPGRLPVAAIPAKRWPAGPTTARRTTTTSKSRESTRPAAMERPL